MTIQAAITAASPGDTILVSANTYRENLVITKSLNLVGSSPANTIIDASGSGSAITVSAASAVYIFGFSIRNTGIYDSGIVVSLSTNITISGNVVQASSQTNGTFLVNSNSSTVRGNVFTGNDIGISVSGGFGNLIVGNNATGNRDGDIYVTHSSGNRITDNVLRLSLTGLKLLRDAVGNIVARNLIANETFGTYQGEGVSIVDSPSAGNLFVENRIEFNRATADMAGVSIQNSTLNRFYHNVIANNSIQFFGVFNPDITSNNWDNATGYALKMDPKIMFVDSNNNNVWDFNETVIYDTDNNGRYDLGDIVIASPNGVVPAPGILLKMDQKIKFVDPDNNGIWEHGEPVVYDNNNNSVFDSGEPAIAGVGGNFWSNYRGLDNGSHGFTADGIGDTLIPTPCSTPARPCSVAGPPGVDWYPLMTPWRPSNLNVTVSARPLGGYPSLQVSFTGSVTGGLAPYSFSWNFGDGSATPQQNPIHIYSSKGTYIATLTVTDASSKTGSNEIPITVLTPIGNLALRIVDQNANTLQGVNITMLSTPQGQLALSHLTNGTGTVVFAGLLAGSYLVRASSPGYQAATKNVTVVAGQTVSQQLVLTRLASSNGLSTTLIAGVVGVAAGALLLLFMFSRRRKKRFKMPVSAPKS